MWRTELLAPVKHPSSSLDALCSVLEAAFNNGKNYAVPSFVFCIFCIFLTCHIYSVACSLSARMFCFCFVFQLLRRSLQRGRNSSSQSDPANPYQTLQVTHLCVLPRFLLYISARYSLKSVLALKMS